MKKKYYPQHMHIHSIYEPGASMEGHIYFAKLLGMKHIWFTEHDILWDKKAYRCGFEVSELIPDENGVPTDAFLLDPYSNGDVKIDTVDSYEGESALRITAAINQGEDWLGASATTVGSERQAGTT